MSILDEADRNIANLEECLRNAQTRGDETGILFFTQALSDARRIRNDPLLGAIDQLFGTPPSRD